MACEKNKENGYKEVFLYSLENGDQVNIGTLTPWDSLWLDTDNKSLSDLSSFLNRNLGNTFRISNKRLIEEISDGV